MANKVHQVVAIATGASLEVADFGFEPRSIKIQNATSLAMLEWHWPMPVAGGFKTVSTGTRTLQTSGGITPALGKFTLGTMTDINDAADEVLYITVTD